MSLDKVKAELEAVGAVGDVLPEPDPVVTAAEVIEAINNQPPEGSTALNSSRPAEVSALARVAGVRSAAETAVGALSALVEALRGLEEVLTETEGSDVVQAQDLESAAEVVAPAPKPSPASAAVPADLVPIATKPEYPIGDNFSSEGVESGDAVVIDIPPSVPLEIET